MTGNFMHFDVRIKPSLRTQRAFMAETGSDAIRFSKLSGRRKSSALLALAFFPTLLKAAAFSAVCHDVLTHGYRSGTDVTGAPLEDEWTTDEMFNSEWKFLYDGRARFVLVDGEEMKIVSQRVGVLIVLGKPNSAPLGTSITTYVIHTGLKKIVISQVQGNSGLGDGVMGRVTNLECEFTTH